MAYAPKDMAGRIYDNKASKTKKSQPDYTGTINVRGELIRVAGWYQPPDEKHRVGSIGLSLTNKEEHDRERQSREGTGPQIHPNTDESAVQRKLAENAPKQDDFDDDIPF